MGNDRDIYKSSHLRNQRESSIDEVNDIVDDDYDDDRDVDVDDENVSNGIAEEMRRRENNYDNADCDEHQQSIDDEDEDHLIFGEEDEDNAAISDRYLMDSALSHNNN